MNTVSLMNPLGTFQFSIAGCIAWIMVVMGIAYSTMFIYEKYKLLEKGKVRDNHVWYYREWGNIAALAKALILGLTGLYLFVLVIFTHEHLLDDVISAVKSASPGTFLLWLMAAWAVVWAFEKYLKLRLLQEGGREQSDKQSGFLTTLFSREEQNG